MISRKYHPIPSIKALGSHSASRLPNEINVLVWNIFKCQKIGWMSDFIHLKKSQHLMLLQESLLNSKFDAVFMNSRRFHWVMARSFRYVKTDIETGIKTGAVVVPCDKVLLESEYMEPLSKTKKMSLMTRYALPNSQDELMVINTHIVNFVSFYKFTHQIDQVLEWVDRHSGPVILAGDFNTWNRKRWQYFSQATKNVGLQEVSFRRVPRAYHLFQHLDHVFYRSMKVMSAEVLTHVRSSDHFPLSIRFCL